MNRFATQKPNTMIKRSVLILTLAILSFYAKAQQTYRIDIKKSKILWNNRKIMGGHYGDILFASGSLTYSQKQEPLKGFFTIDMNSMRAIDSKELSENKRVNGELKKESMFDMSHYPTASMNVKQITRIGSTHFYKITGDLTIKGNTNPIEFNATIKNQGDVVTATAELEIDRLKWHIDMQPSPKSWEIIAAMKNQLIASNIAISLNLMFNKN